eukprot:GAHX01001882.1.p1 GENE.GAHX01001882.1~~GAHX01001882.1.p1  ORF type:complete len:406 (+),score=80.26 GAHX01001882.1:1186-2403(+)
MKDNTIEEEIPFIGRPSNNLSMGIVGLPNVGKSLLFNQLSGSSVASSNYSFCTIDPNSARAVVSEKRLELFKKVYQPKSLVPPTLNLTDIAGLVSGASDGKGLGNAFLSHIGAVDAIYHVVRAFNNPEVEHFEGDVDPVRDLGIIKKELIKKDLQKMEKFQIETNKKLRGVKSKKLEDTVNTVNKVIECLKEGNTILSRLKPTGHKGGWTAFEIDLLNQWLLLTSKPVVYLVNVSLTDWIKGGNKHFKAIKAWVEEEDAPRECAKSVIMPFSAEYEKLVLEKDDKINKLMKKYKKESVKGSVMPKIIDEGYHTLNLLHFFTAGPEEVKCWTIRKGTKAKEAAGCIHGDIEKSFINAEVFNFKDFESCDGSRTEMAKKGLIKLEGKQYVVKEGDVILFKSGLGKKR